METKPEKRSGRYQTITTPTEKNTVLQARMTGHKPNRNEINAFVNYSDYYYLKAILRYRNLKKK